MAPPVLHLGRAAFACSSAKEPDVRKPYSDDRYDREPVDRIVKGWKPRALLQDEHERKQHQEDPEEHPIEPTEELSAAGGGFCGLLHSTANRTARVVRVHGWRPDHHPNLRQQRAAAPLRSVGPTPAGWTTCPQCLTPGVPSQAIPALAYGAAGVRPALTAVLVYATVLPLLYLTPLIERTLGRVGALVLTRILYIFIAAKAVAFVVGGIRGSFG